VAAAALLGWKVSILERLVGEVLAFAGAYTSTRWLHPHIYEWPAIGMDEPKAGLPILDWESGSASRVISGLRTQWARIRDDRDIAVHVGVTDVMIDGTNPGWTVSWNGYDPGGEGRPAGQHHDVDTFDVVILAVGFGEERPNEKFPQPVCFSYWKPDEIDVPRAGATRTPQVLVSGTGDGGLIDVLRCTREQVLGLPFWDTPWWRGSEEMKARIRVATEQASAGNVFREELRARGNHGSRPSRSSQAARLLHRGDRRDEHRCLHEGVCPEG
jgi:hypothetical protein